MKPILRAEHLTRLGAGDLAGVAAGTATGLTSEQGCPTSNLFTGMYPSINMRCTDLLPVDTTTTG